MRRRCAGALLLAGAGIYLTTETVAAAAWTDPEYSYLYNYVSDLGVFERGIVYNGREVDSPLAWLMNTGFVASGLAMSAGAVLLQRGRKRWRTPVLVLAAAYAAGNTLIAAFPEYPPEAAVGHGVGAALAIVGGNLLVIAVGEQLHGAFPRTARAAQALGALGLVSITVLVGTDVERVGLVERMAIYTITAFQLGVGARLLFAARRTQ